MQRLLTEVRHMLLAFQIMSRIPINIALPCQPDDMIGSMVYFPLVGAVVGALMALAGWLGYALTGSYIAAGICPEPRGAHAHKAPSISRAYIFSISAHRG